MSRSRRFRSSNYGKLSRFLEDYRAGPIGFSLFCKRAALIFLILLLHLVVFFTGVNDKEAMSLYLAKLQTLSEHNIKNEQKQRVKFFYSSDKRNRDPLKAERHRVRHEFESKKNKLRKQWEARYSIKWPSTIKTKLTIEKNKKASELKTQNNFTKNRNFLSAESIPIMKERMYEAHHIIPINAGGINVWWNITPLNSRNHSLLHESIEEKACFSHDLVHRAIMRFLLRFQGIFREIFKKYISKRPTIFAAHDTRLQPLASIRTLEINRSTA